MGLFSVIVPALLALPVTTAPAAPKPHPVRAAVQSLAVAGVDPAALAGDTGVPAGKGKPFLLSSRKQTAPYSTLGVTWQRGSGSQAVSVLVRTRGGDGWSPWTPLEIADDDGPDDVSPEAQDAGVRVGTAATWVDEAGGVQVRLDVPSGPAPRDVRIELVDPGASKADATLGQDRAPQSTAFAATQQPTVITRAQWGADESQRSSGPSYASTVKVAYVHHTASTNDYTADQAAQQVRGFYAYHTRSLGWADIGYNFLVDKFGRVYEGRYGGISRAVVGAHAGGFNSGSTGVSMMGTYTSVAPTTATIDAVRDLLAWKLSLHGADPLGKQVLTSGGGSSSKYAAGTQVTVPVILGHRDTNNTACPGDQGYSKLPALRRSVADRIAASSQSTTAAIDAKYAALGGSSGLLGAPTSAEAAAPGGRFRSYQGGTIYWSTATGAYEVHGAILDRWSALGRLNGTGYPQSDERIAPDGVGRFNHFQGGSIYWTPGTGAWAVHGAIREAWGRLGWEGGSLGYPLVNESPTKDGIGRYNHFQSGSIYWTPKTGAQGVQGAIRQVWSGSGWENGPLGYPVTSELVTPDRTGRFNHFQNGSIYWTPGTGPQSVQGGIRTVWSELGWERGPLGYPITHELIAPDGRGRFNHFQNGSIYWSPVAGASEVRGAIRQRWASLGWEQSRLGYPTSNEYAVPGGRRSDFERGSIVFSFLTGRTTVI
jgi:uncharacterized protein with LGFP repeats